MKHSSIIRSLALVILFAACHPSRKISSSIGPSEMNLRSHIQFLADDKLEGRRTGSEGERLAMEYIRAAFQKNGLAPKGDSGYYQAFEVYDGKVLGDSTWFYLNGHKLEAFRDFFPFAYSANQKIESTPSIAIQEADEPWFFDLKEILEENKNNTHFDLPDYIRKNAGKAKDRGAAAVILYNSSSIKDKLSFEAKDRAATAGIPVIYLSNEVAKQYLKDSTASLTVKLNVDLQEKRRTGHNVIGYLDNGAAETIVLGAHFDHLGKGEDGNSRHINNDPIIHNGADDNASGTAALLELSRTLKQTNLKGHNYLFIAFSGEELGLFGSKYFTEHPSIDLRTVDYMINMDMVGRLNDSSRVLTIGGYGTSPAWSKYIAREFYENSGGQKKNIPSLVIRIDSSGTGPSDHTSFYRKDIPVLFYFTGLHTDYHKPSDDADKINYAGERLVISHIIKLMESLDKEPKLVFTKTRETSSTGSRAFSVSMGIMPDYTYSGNGVRADGISDGKPAQKAGLKAGDIILQVGDFSISSMDNYMQALGKFVKGEKALVKFKRGEKMMEVTVEF